jgi:ABC-type lipoprotein release transport system permease subunit
VKPLRSVVALFVVTIAALSCLGPLRRALSIEPTQALRADQ